MFSSTMRGQDGSITARKCIGYLFHNCQCQNTNCLKSYTKTQDRIIFNCTYLFWVSGFRSFIRQSKMSPLGQDFLQTLQALTSKEEVLEIHREKHGLSREEAETIWNNYLEFIVIKARHGDTSGKEMRFSTTPKIDALWHTHLLNT